MPFGKRLYTLQLWMCYICITVILKNGLVEKLDYNISNAAIYVSAVNIILDGFVSKLVYYSYVKLVLLKKLRIFE